MSTPALPRSVRRFTGAHMAVILAGFFLVVIAVNLLMARLAVGSFGGTVVDNAYVESQRFNAYLARARAQDQRHWHAALTTETDRVMTLTLRDAAGRPLVRLHPRAVAQHPLGRAADIALLFREVAPGRYRADRPLPPGRWHVRVTLGPGAYLLRDID